MLPVVQEPPSWLGKAPAGSHAGRPYVNTGSSSKLRWIPQPKFRAEHSFRHWESEIPWAVAWSRMTKRSGTPRLHGLLSVLWCCGTPGPTSALLLAGWALPVLLQWFPADSVHTGWHWSSLCRLGFTRPGLWRCSSTYTLCLEPWGWVAATR